MSHGIIHVDEEKQRILNDISGNITFESIEHVYTDAHGLRVLSVTQLLQPIQNIVYGDANEIVMMRAAERGTSVHEAIELYEKAGMLPLDDDDSQAEVNMYFKGYVKWRKENPQVQIWGSEVPVFERSQRYAGTVDLITVDHVLIDIKTTAMPLWGLHGVQLAAYAKAVDPHYRIDKAQILYLHKDGEYTLSNYTGTQLSSLYVDFLCCLRIMTRDWRKAP